MLVGSERVNNPLAHPLHPRETQCSLQWCRPPSEPKAHLWAVTQQKAALLSDITTETVLWAGAKWETGCGGWRQEKLWTTWESHFSPPAFLYLSHKHFEDSPEKPEPWQLQTTALLEEIRGARGIKKTKERTMNLKRTSLTQCVAST